MPDRQSAEVVLAARSLVAGYGSAPVVQSLDLELRAGEIVALFGPNGAGKSTTLLALAGDLPTMGGEVLWRGAAVSTPLYRRAKEGLVLVPEQRSVLASLSVRDNLLLGAGGVAPALELFPELTSLLKRRAGLLSGGEQQMLTLARALAADPVVLLIDELSLGLAPIIVERLLGRLIDVARDRRVAVLLVEQQARRALTVCDRWVLMRRGRLVGSGDASSGIESLAAAYLVDAEPSTS